MNEITTLLICLQPHLNQTLLKQLAIISQSILCMPDRVTMLGMSRWSEAGGSYRTIQRFFKQESIPWMKLNWALTKPKLEEESVVLVVADSSTVTKSGHCTNGLGRFFSSIYSRAVRKLKDTHFVAGIFQLQKLNGCPLTYPLIQIIRQSGGSIKLFDSTKNNFHGFDFEKNTFNIKGEK